MVKMICCPILTFLVATLAVWLLSQLVPLDVAKSGVMGAISGFFMLKRLSSKALTLPA